MRSRCSAGLFACLLIGACGGDKPPEAPKGPGTPAALADVARQCARIASCADAHDSTHVRNPTSCVDWWLVSTNVEQTALACLSRARSCKDLEACTHEPHDREAMAYCTAHPGALGVCEGARLISCSDVVEESSAIDCSALGGTCVEQRVAGGLVVRGCSSPKLCPPGAPLSRCEGAAVVRCEDGMADRRECPSGTRCAARDTEASCEGEPARDRSRRCLKPGFAACEGDRVTFCTLVGREAWLRSADCAAFGMTCGMRDGRANCVTRGGTCEAPDARCDGDALVFCAAGAQMRVSCRDLGFAKCDPAARGQEAACR